MLSGRKNPRPYRLALTIRSQGMQCLPKVGDSSSRAKQASTCSRPFGQPTHQTLRPALNGLTNRTRHHARLPAELKIFFRDTANTTPPGSRNLRMGTTRRNRLLPIRPNLNPRRRETRLMPGHPCQETSATIARSLSLPQKTSRTTRSLRS